MNIQTLEISSMLLDEETVLSLAELCRYCSLPAEQVMTMIEQGIIEPQNPDPTAKNWQFAGLSLVRVQTVKRLQRDLGVNLEGAALALDLLDEVKTLRQQIKALRRAMQEAEAWYE